MMGVSARGRDSSFSQNQDWSASAACWLSVTLSYIASDRLPYIPESPPFSLHVSCVLSSFIGPLTRRWAPQAVAVFSQRKSSRSHTPVRPAISLRRSVDRSILRRLRLFCSHNLLFWTGSARECSLRAIVAVELLGTESAVDSTDRTSYDRGANSESRKRRIDIVFVIS